MRRIAQERELLYLINSRSFGNRDFSEETGIAIGNQTLQTSSDESKPNKDIPLIHRMQMGIGYCTLEEWKAIYWLWQKLHSRHDKYTTATVAEWLRHESYYFGVCGIEVPFSACNPWIVDQLICEMGGKRENYCVWNQAIGINQQIPYSISFTYKTINEGIVWQL